MPNWLLGGLQQTALGAGQAYTKQQEQQQMAQAAMQQYMMKTTFEAKLAAQLQAQKHEDMANAFEMNAKLSEQNGNTDQAQQLRQAAMFARQAGSEGLSAFERIMDPSQHLAISAGANEEAIARGYKSYLAAPEKEKKNILDVAGQRTVQKSVDIQQQKREALKKDLKPIAKQAATTGAVNPALFNRFSGNSELIAEIMAEDYPDKDPSKIAANAKFRMDPVLNRAMVYANGVIPRLDDLNKKVKNLKNTDIQAINFIVNGLKLQFGQPEIIDFMSNRNATVLEALRVLSGGVQTSDLRVKMEAGMIDPKMSPAQLKIAIVNLKRNLQILKEARQSLPYPDWRTDQAISADVKIQNQLNYRQMYQLIPED